MRFSTLAVSLFLLRGTVGLRVTKGSPCEDDCGLATNTTGEEIVCRDRQFYDDDVGRQFEKCVSCELQSKFSSSTSREEQSDVKWGLYNLRYSFSSCIYGIPASKQSVSTPCQVSCDSLRPALISGLSEPDGPSMYDFCGMSSFADSIVTQCAACYALTEDEKYLANFIEVIRQGCHSKVPGGTAFFVHPKDIFTTAALEANESPNAVKNSSSGKSSLALKIALPIVGILLLLIACCVGCFCIVRRRRRRAKRNDQSSALHERWNDTSIITPVPGGLQKFWGEPPQQQSNEQYMYHQPDHQQPLDGQYIYHQPSDQQYNHYYNGQQDVKSPPEAYVMTNVNHDQIHPAPGMTETEKPAIESPIPILSNPPPGRKSLSKS
ncbi:hypothetical protein FQN57_007044 [Myotisia sp. PD_48]|nr:hypothetical protein FQN57_007044 [Myotisia sp. PD_48]